jgi:DNA-directed RNA polymerase specialized sigma24 family protein
LKNFIARYSAAFDLPLEDAEARIHVAVDAAARSAVKHYSIPGWTREDVYQSGALAALEALRKGAYDFRRPLGIFLTISARNALFNIARKCQPRKDLCCRRCDPDDPPAEPCEKYQKWADMNRRKQALAESYPLLREAPYYDAGIPRVDYEDALESLSDEAREVVRRRLDSQVWGRVRTAMRIDHARQAEICAEIRECFGVAA